MSDLQTVASWSHHIRLHEYQVEEVYAPSDRSQREVRRKEFGRSIQGVVADSGAPPIKSAS